MKKKASIFVAGMLISLAASNIIPSISIEAHAEEGLKNCAVIVGKEKTYNSINEAVKNATENDTIKVYPGTYNETISIKKDGLTIVGEEGAVISGSEKLKPKSGKESLIQIEGNNITVSNLEFTNFVLSGPSSDVSPKAIEVDGNSEHITISDCKIHDMGVNYTKNSEDYNAHGILVSAEPDEPIKDVTISGCELYNLKLGQSEALVVNGNVDGFKIENNYIHNCDNIAIDAIGYEKDKHNDDDRAHNGEIFNNTVCTISSRDNVAYGGDISAGGIYVDGGYDVEIHDNYISDADIGIEVSAECKKKVVTGVKVYNNVLVRNNGWAGICIGGSDPKDNGEAKENEIYNNTVYNTEEACLRIQNAHDDSNKIHNNIFIATDSAEAYSEECGNNSKHNVVKDNKSNQKMSASDNSTFKLKGASSNKMSVEISTSDDLSGYGAPQTKVNN
ncbi:MAG: right-handed parallel beta-helix repeat-containing protein [Butyrivibrio sp.]|nr:right-handed parallel beta-helix repeat-containing protein [Butyrivibrio sp.]